MIVDTNGKDLMRYNKKYVVVIDRKPFSLNNYEETLENLMALNFIMKEEIPDFSFTDIMRSEGKTYYTVSEDTYNKVNKLKTVKGIYTYIYDEADRKKAWSVSTFLSDIPREDLEEGSLYYELNEYLKYNNEPFKNFYLDDKAIYNKSELNISDDNRNLQLTIDKGIEDKVRDVISKEEYSKFSNIGVMIMESNTGKIRAMVQKDESDANINLCIEGSGYEPGSVFKLITLGAALDKWVVTLGDTFNCSGAICKNHVHGNINVEKAIEVSCNDVFAKIGNKVGYDDLMDYAEKSGLFKPVLNMRGSGKNETSGLKPKKDSGLNNISIGQCLNLSPIQMLGATNAIVNDGVYIKPYLIENILDKDDNIIETIKPEKEKVYSKTTSKLLKNSMIEVVKNGTGIKSKVDGIEIGGKTGSATTADHNTHGWFSGFYKQDGKLYTMVVFLPNIDGKAGEGVEIGGGDTAAPIFGDIVKALNNK